MKNIITVVDENEKHQASLKLLLNSLRRYHPSQNVTVLAPINSLPASYLDWLQNMNMLVVHFPPRNFNDPYQTKFLLSNYINSKFCVEDELLYLDPDHICVLPPKFEGLNANQLHISSQPNAVFDPIGAYYNTSIIYSSVVNLRLVGEIWEQEYVRIKSSVDYRHREELAFAIAAYRNNIQIVPVSTSFQSNLEVYNSSCSFFHYGGESIASQKIKSFILMNNPQGHLEKLLSEDSRDSVNFIIKELISVI